MTTFIRNRAVLMGVGLVALALAGCSEGGKREPKLQRIEGVAKVIDVERNHVSMTRMDDKGKPNVVEGTVREDAEILINGRSHKLADIRPGDKVVVTGYSEGEGQNKKRIVTRVEVTRPRAEDWKPTGATTAAQKPPAEAPKTVTTIDDTAKKPEVAARAKADPPKLASDDAEKSVQAREAMDLIYANIRIRMEEAIEQRATLLKEGTSPTDPKIRDLETTILKARSLLIEAGEVIEDIEPPIATAEAPTTKPGGKPDSGNVIP